MLYGNLSRQTWLPNVAELLHVEVKLDDELRIALIRQPNHSRLKEGQGPSSEFYQMQQCKVAYLHSKYRHSLQKMPQLQPAPCCLHQLFHDYQCSVPSEPSLSHCDVLSSPCDDDFQVAQNRRSILLHSNQLRSLSERQNQGRFLTSKAIQKVEPRLSGIEKKSRQDFGSESRRQCEDVSLHQ